MALLAAEPLDLGHCHAVDADLGQGLAYIVQLERFDDGFNLLHGDSLPVLFAEPGRDGIAAVLTKVASRDAGPTAA